MEPLRAKVATNEQSAVDAVAEADACSEALFADWRARGYLRRAEQRPIARNAPFRNAADVGMAP